MDLRFPGVPSGHLRTNKGLYVPSDGLIYGYPFDPFPAIDGNRPAYAFTANTVVGSGGDFSSAPNHGTAGGTWEVGASNNAPRLTTNELGNKPSLDFDRANNEAIHSSVATTVTAPYTILIVCDYDAASTSIIHAASENGASNSHQLWESGSNNANVNSGSTRTASGAMPLDRDVIVCVFGNSTTNPQLWTPEDGTLLTAGSTGATAMEGAAIGSNNVPDTTNTMNGDVAWYAAYPGDIGSGDSDFDTLISNLQDFYDLTGA